MTVPVACFDTISARAPLITNEIKQTGDSFKPAETVEKI
jgi:hypothetical protein